MSRYAVPILVAVLGAGWFASGCLLAQVEARKVPYSREVPIKERLLPDDNEVLVYKQGPPGLIPNPTIRQSYEQEVQRMKLSEIVALVRVLSAQGELVDNGTWIQTNVFAQISQLVKGNAGKQPENSLEFKVSGGNTKIGQVGVTASPFPRFVPGDEYLVFLVTRPSISLAVAFRVNSNALLEPIKTDTGEPLFQTQLIGRGVSEVLEALKR